MDYTILVAAFDEQLCPLIEDFLKGEREDYKILKVNDKEIYEKSLALLPDAVLIDCDTLKSNGLENVKALKQNPKTQEIPVLLLAEFDQLSAMEKAFDYGVVDFVKKPLDREDLLIRLSTIRARQRFLVDIYKEQERLEELSIVARNSANSVVVIGAEGFIEWVNEGFENMYGYSVDEFREKFGDKIFNPEENPHLHKAIEHCKSTLESYVYENRWVTKSNQEKWIQTTLTPVTNEHDDIIKYIAIESDVTDLKIAEKRLEAKTDHLLTLTEHLESTNELLDKQRQEIEKQKEAIEEQKKKSDDLLLNVLPFETAEQLKKKGFAKSKNYRRVTVMFTDFVGFSKLSAKLSTQDLIKELNIYFEKFDEIIEGHFIEKIKTIGDAYMCAGGLPLRNKSNPIDVTLAALEIQKFIRDLAEEKKKDDQPVWEIRLGIHTGEVIAGVIGKKKFAYDIWGDTVNSAARMQEAGEPGRVNVSGDTYEYIQDYFDCTFRGEIEVKNKGEIAMYYVNRLKEEYSADKEGTLPNQEFKKILAKY